MIPTDMFPPDMRRRLLLASTRIQKAAKRLAAANAAVEKPDATWKEVNVYWAAVTETGNAARHWLAVEQSAREALPEIVV